jgi:hypothetical protein
MSSIKLKEKKGLSLSQSKEKPKLSLDRVIDSIASTLQMLRRSIGNHLLMVDCLC